MSNKTTDLSYLKELARGNNEFIVEMIGIFLEQIKNNIDLLKSYINEKNWKEAEFLSHKMKSSYAYFGVSELQESMRVIETDCHTGEIDIPKLSRIIERAEELTGIVISELENELKNLS